MNSHESDARSALKNLSHQDFLNFGVQQIAYIKPIKLDEGKGYAIHAADGTALSVMDSLDGAITLARHNNLYPVTIH
ncbi:MAG TPA: DUF1150 family protein [Alphaproteobacteria bacterium]|nr:DUF1150 family protein [Alphaproteobacteria bacterium]